MKHYEIATAIRADLLAGTATEEARAEYRYIRKTYAAERDALVTMHGKSYSPAETVADLVEAIGYENAAEIVAIMVIAKGTWDERISAKVRAWAGDLVTITPDEIHDVLGLYYSDSIHPVHMDQLARAMMAYTPAETETTEAPAESRAEAAEGAEAPETTNSTPDTESPAEAEETATVPVLDLLDDLDTGNHGDRLNDYRDSSAYICDAVAEIADADTSIYYSDIMDFVREHPDALADVIAEGLYDPAYKYDFYEHAQAAEYMTIERDIYDHLADSLLVAAVNFIRHDLNRDEIPAELVDLLREWCDDADSGDRMNEIPDQIREYFDSIDGGDFEVFCAANHCTTCICRDCKTTAECRARFEEVRA